MLSRKLSGIQLFLVCNILTAVSAHPLGELLDLALQTVKNKLSEGASLREFSSSTLGGYHGETDLTEFQKDSLKDIFHGTYLKKYHIVGYMDFLGIGPTGSGKSDL